MVDSVTGKENTVFQCQAIQVLFPKYIDYSLTNVEIKLSPIFLFTLYFQWDNSHIFQEITHKWLFHPGTDVFHLWRKRRQRCR